VRMSPSDVRNTTLMEKLNFLIRNAKSASRTLSLSTTEKLMSVTRELFFNKCTLIPKVKVG
jgi:hypothetical protein